MLLLIWRIPLALNIDLTLLVRQLTAVDALLIAAQNNITKYPRLFSPVAVATVVAARAEVVAVIKELTDGTNLITELTATLKV